MIKRIKIRKRLYADPNVVEPRWQKRHKGYYIPGQGGMAIPGNRCAAIENISAEAHARRVAGMMRALAVHYKRHKGIKAMKQQALRQHSKDIKRGLREKYRETVVHELRDIQEKARKNAVAAMDIAKEIMMNGEKDSDRLAAANLVLERAYGKATQTNLNASVDANGSQKEVSTEELNQRIGKALRRVEELTGGTPKPPPSQNGPTYVRKRYRNSGGPAVH